MQQPQQSDPFAHLDPSLWSAARGIHIVLFSSGTLLMIPALYLAFAMMTVLPGSGMMDAEETLMLIGMILTLLTGTLTWLALGILFFKRNDGRWHCLTWHLAIFHGWTALSFSSIGFLLMLDDLETVLEYVPWLGYTIIATLLLTFLSGLVCAVHAPRLHRLSKASLASRLPPRT